MQAESNENATRAVLEALEALGRAAFKAEIDRLGAAIEKAWGDFEAAVKAQAPAEIVGRLRGNYLDAHRALGAFILREGGIR